MSESRLRVFLDASLTGTPLQLIQPWFFRPNACPLGLFSRGKQKRCLGCWTHPVAGTMMHDTVFESELNEDVYLYGAESDDTQMSASQAMSPSPSPAP